MTILHRAIVSMHKSLRDHHARCAETLDGHARGCDPEDPHAGVFKVLAQEHQAMSAHHRAAAAELDASPEVEEFSGHDAQPHRAAAGILFAKSELDASVDALPLEMRKLVKNGY